MYIPDAMKVENKFVDVALPSNKSLFSRLGTVAPVSQNFTGDDPALMNQDKIQQIEDYKRFAESEMSKESNSE